MKALHSALPTLVFAIVPMVHIPQAATLTALGVLSSGAPASQASAVTPDGRHVVGDSSSGAGVEAFRWSAEEGMVGLGYLAGGARSEARGVSADGSRVTGVAFPAGGGQVFEPFLWTPSGGLRALDRNVPPGFRGAGVNGITPDGLVVIGAIGLGAEAPSAYLWSESDGYRVLPRRPGDPFDSNAMAVSADGRVVAGTTYSTGSRGFRWTAEGGFAGLGPLAGGRNAQSEVYGMSANGRFITGLVVNEENGAPGMMLWSAEDGMAALGHLPGGEGHSIGFGVTEDGRMVVGEAAMPVVDPAFPFPVPLPRAAVWRSGIGLRPLWDLLTELGVNPAADGWSALVMASAVSGDGRYVVGMGRRNGRNEAFRADLATSLELVDVAGRPHLVWPEGFKLQRTDSLNPAAWSDVSEAQSPWEIPAGSPSGFFRMSSTP